MENRKFVIMRAEDGEEYLGLDQNGKTSFVYRCVLHQHPRTAAAIPSGLELKDPSSRWYQLIRDFTPLLYTPGDQVFYNGNQVVIDDPTDNFSIGNRSDIVGSRETTKHLRFRRWQIYLFPHPSKEPLHPGLWDRIKINQPLPEGSALRPPGYGP